MTPVAIPVGGDGRQAFQPHGPIRGFGLDHAEPPSPRLAVRDRLLSERKCATFDERSPFVDRLAILVAHRAERFGDQAGNEAWLECRDCRVASGRWPR